MGRRRVWPGFRLIFGCWLWIGCAGGMEEGTVHRLLGGQRVRGHAISPYAYEYFLRARLAFDAGEWAEAAEEIDLALTSDPDSTYLLAWHARALDLAGRRNAAERRLDEALRIDPDAELAWTVRGEIAERHGRLDAAERSLRRAVRAAPSSDDAVLDLGAFLERHSRTAAAEEAYRTGAARRPRSARIWQALGRVLLDEGRTDASLWALGRAASAGRLDRRGLVALALAERRSGRPGRAVEILGVVTALQPRDVESRAARADAAIDAGLGTTARELVESLRLHEPEGPSAKRAERLLASGHPDGAIEEARAAIASDAMDGPARIVLARACREKGDDAGLADALAAVPPHDAGSIDAPLVVAARLVDARELDAARILLDGLVARAPDDPRARRLLADVALRQGDDRSAERVLREGGAQTVRELAALLGDSDRAGEGTRALRAAARSSTDALVWADLALWEKTAGERGAARSLERALSLGRDRPEVLLAAAALAPATEADARFAAADRARPGQPRLFALWAESKESRGLHIDSRALLERALRLRPSPLLRARLERRLRSLAERSPPR